MIFRCCLVFLVVVAACEAPEAGDAAAAPAVPAALESQASAESAAAGAVACGATPQAPLRIPNNLPVQNLTGSSTTFSTAGSVDLQGPFFEALGTNERTCGSCHASDQGWTISAAGTQQLFDATRGKAPIFRAVDGANAPDADLSTLRARRDAFSMLLKRGTIRVGIGMPDGADFELAAVDDPYGHACADELSLFRRPLPATNLAFASGVMWDGRVTGSSLQDALASQANGATQGHAQRPTPLDQATRNQIVAFETGLFTAQIFDRTIGPLDVNGGHGDAEDLAGQTVVDARWDLFDAYRDSGDPKYQALYRGQELFNTRRRPDGHGSCQGCHSQSNVGTSVKGSFFNIGTAAGTRREPDQPLYTFTELSTGAVVQVTDPGRALITGKFADLGRFKVPALRGLAARPPYFHDGSARTLVDVVAFYRKVLGFVFTDDEAADMQAFLAAL
ncbi:MAG: hypothetical protein ABJA82_05995 [Myxococcales bacterium]